MSEQTVVEKAVEAVPVPQPKRFQCPECKNEYTVSEVESERPVEQVQEKGLVEHGLKCPNCGYWLHVYFSTIKQRKARQKVEQTKRDWQRHKNNHTLKVYNGAIKRHRKVFDATQKRVRKLVGVKAGPAEILKKIEEFKKVQAAAKAAEERPAESKASAAVAEEGVDEEE